MKFKTAYLYAIGKSDNMRKCLVCGKPLISNQKKFCSELHAGQYAHPPEGRNKDIVALLETSHYTLKEIGLRYNLSRERIRQIYHHATGHGFIIHIQTVYTKRTELAKKRKLIRDNSLKFNCNACKKPVLYKEGHRLHKLCRDCSYLSKKLGRDVYVTKICLVCKTSFHPYRNMRAPSSHSKGIYCNHKCYSLSGAKRGQYKKYSDEFLIKKLKQFLKQKKRLPKENDFKNKHPSRRVYYYRFGPTWHNVLRKAGLIK